MGENLLNLVLAFCKRLMNETQNRKPHGLGWPEKGVGLELSIARGALHPHLLAHVWRTKLPIRAPSPLFSMQQVLCRK